MNQPKTIARCEPGDSDSREAWERQAYAIRERTTGPRFVVAPLCQVVTGDGRTIRAEEAVAEADMTGFVALDGYDGGSGEPKFAQLTPQAAMARALAIGLVLETQAPFTEEARAVAPPAKPLPMCRFAGDPPDMQTQDYPIDFGTPAAREAAAR
jgi:hypothetical protein